MDVYPEVATGLAYPHDPLSYAGVAELLVRPLMPDMSEAGCQTKKRQASNLIKDVKSYMLKVVMNRFGIGLTIR